MAGAIGANGAEKRFDMNVLNRDMGGEEQQQKYLYEKIVTQK